MIFFTLTEIKYFQRFVKEIIFALQTEYIPRYDFTLGDILNISAAGRKTLVVSICEKTGSLIPSYIRQLMVMVMPLSGAPTRQWLLNLLKGHSLRASIAQIVKVLVG